MKTPDRNDSKLGTVLDTVSKPIDFGFQRSRVRGTRVASLCILGLSLNPWWRAFITEGLRERTEHLDIFLLSAYHSMVFYFWWCSVYWWKGSVRFYCFKILL